MDESRKPFTGQKVNVPWLNKEKYEAYEIDGKVKVKGEPRDVSRRVYTMKDIDLNQKNRKGFTNLQLMKNGNAPFAKDGTQINLHHLIQEEPGTMLEIPESWHNKYSDVLHGLKGMDRVLEMILCLINNIKVSEEGIGDGELSNLRIKNKR